MNSRIICDARDMELMLARMSAEVLEEHAGKDELVVIGIRRRGADLAARLVKLLYKGGISTQLGSLDINLYRDDWTMRSGGMPITGASDMPTNLEGASILLVDDVLFTGRTIRAALEAIMDYGRPRRIELLVLIDRGHREMPICPAYVGKRMATRTTEHIDVRLKESDGEDSVILLQK